MIGVILDFMDALLYGYVIQYSSLSILPNPPAYLRFSTPTLYSYLRLKSLKTGHFNLKDCLKIAEYWSLLGIVTQRQCIFLGGGGGLLCL